MNGVPTILEYDVTPDDVWQQARRVRATLRRRWTQRLGALVYLLIILEIARSGNWMIATGCALLLASWWFGWVFWFLRAFAAPYRVCLEFDDRGIVMSTSPSNSRQRYWWRTLRTVRELPDAVEIDFGNEVDLRVPRDAFATDDERAEFLASVNNRLTARCVVAATR